MEQEKGKKSREISPLAGESGMMAVEAVLSFTVFIVAVLAIVYLINIFTLHNRVQFAINSAAHELAAYSYAYQALGVRSAEQAVKNDGDPYTKPIDGTVTQVADSLNKIQVLYGDVTQMGNDLQEVEASPESVQKIADQLKKTAEDGEAAVESVNQSVQDVGNLFSDGQSLLVGMIYMGASRVSYEVKSAAATFAAKGLTKKYLENGGQSADEYLRSYGVRDGYGGLDFSGSTMFCDSGTGMRTIDIVVEYDVDLSFLGLILPESGRKLHVVQRVSTAAWLDGDGKTFGP